MCLHPTPNTHMVCPMPNPNHRHPRKKPPNKSPSMLHHPYKQEFLLFMIPFTFISTDPNPYRQRASYFSPSSKLLLFADTVNSSCQSYTFSPDQTPLFLPIFPLETSYSDPHQLLSFFSYLPSGAVPHAGFSTPAMPKHQEIPILDTKSIPMFMEAHVCCCLGQDDAGKAMYDPTTLFSGGPPTTPEYSVQSTHSPEINASPH